MVELIKEDEALASEALKDLGNESEIFFERQALVGKKPRRREEKDAALMVRKQSDHRLVARRVER